MRLEIILTIFWFLMIESIEKAIRIMVAKKIRRFSKFIFGLHSYRFYVAEFLIHDGINIKYINIICKNGKVFFLINLLDLFLKKEI